MSFDTILEAILEECGGGLGIALMGTDGIPIHQIPEEGESSGPDITTAGVEFGRVLGELSKASDAVGGGSLEETVVGLANFQLIIRAIDEDVMLVLALSPNGNLGKARYLMRRYLLPLREEL